MKGRTKRERGRGERERGERGRGERGRGDRGRGERGKGERGRGDVVLFRICGSWKDDGFWIEWNTDKRTNISEMKQPAERDESSKSVCSL